MNKSHYQTCTNGLIGTKRLIQQLGKVLSGLELVTKPPLRVVCLNHLANRKAVILVSHSFHVRKLRKRYVSGLLPKVSF